MQQAFWILYLSRDSLNVIDLQLIHPATKMAGNALGLQVARRTRKKCGCTSTSDQGAIMEILSGTLECGGEGNLWSRASGLHGGTAV